MAKRDYDGVFIVFEGIDGSGTTTQVKRYARALRDDKRPVHVTQEPSAGPVGSLLRLALGGRVQLGASNQAQTMALLFAGDRLDHNAHEIGPYLRDGHVVLCDRYDLSSIAYQTATARFEGKSLQDFESWVRDINRYALRPDAVVVIEVDPDEAERRRRERRGALELYEESQLQRRLTAIYADADRLCPDDRVIRIDGNKDVESVTQAVRAALADVIG